MTWRNFISGLSISTLIFGGLLLGLTLFVSPESGPVTLVLYYVSVFFFVMGTATILLFSYRRWRSHNEVIFANVKTSVRQGFLVAAFVCSVLLLSSMRLLNWWDASILAVCFLLAELFFRTRS